MQSAAYEYVVAVAKHRSISRAAQELCITQPALTKYLNRLEDRLGVKLFDRMASPVVLTFAGEKFVEKATMILEIERGLQYDLNRISGNTSGKVAVGMNTEFCANNIPYILPEFRYRYPEIEVTIREGHNKFLFDELEAGRLDLVYAAGCTSYADHFAIKHNYDEAILLAVPMSHPILATMDLSNNSPLTPYYLEPEKVKNCDFIAVIPEQGMGAIARLFFEKHNLNPHIVQEVRKNETALRLASAGMGMIFTPIRTPLRIPLVKPMAYFSLENPIPTRSRDVFYSRHIPLSEAAQCFVRMFDEIYEREKTLQTPTCQLLFMPSK